MARGKVLQEDDEIETLPSEAKRGESVTADLPKTGTPRTPSLSQKRSKQKGSDKSKNLGNTRTKICINIIDFPSALQYSKLC